MIGYWHFMKIWRKSTNISGLSDIKQYNKTKMHSFSQFKPFSKFVYFLGALSFTSAVNKWNHGCLQEVPGTKIEIMTQKNRDFWSKNSASRPLIRPVVWFQFVPLWDGMKTFQNFRIPPNPCDPYLDLSDLACFLVKSSVPLQSMNVLGWFLPSSSSLAVAAPGQK